MIATLICGRAENKPFPGRNTFPLMGRPLMVYPLLAATHSRHVDNIFFSTDDINMSRIAQHYGAEIIERPSWLHAGGIALEDIIGHGYREITKKLGGELEFLIVLLANAPTITNDLIDQGIETMRRNASLDAVISVTLRNDFSPRYAMKLTDTGILRPYSDTVAHDSTNVYFSDALLWVLRPSNYFVDQIKSISPNEIVNTASQSVAPLVHEGYGDVDYVWQIPAVEEWLRRHGFTEEKTPYDKKAAPAGSKITFAGNDAIRQVPPERRVLITTVPFCDGDNGPLNLLTEAGVRFAINPLGRRLKEDELAGMIEDFGILIAGTEPITAMVMDAAPHLRLISRVGVGLDNVDLRAAMSRNIEVTYTPDAPAPAVAELTIGLMLTLLRHITAADRQLRNGIWHRFMGRRLSDMSVGVLGAGRIGQKVIQHLTGGFTGVRILANDLTPDYDFGKLHNVSWTDKETIYKEADIVTVHLPLTPLTRSLIRTPQLTRMKPTAGLINTSRGGIVHEHDLAEALRAGKLAGAAIDVFEREPYSGELTMLNQCVITCHMGSMSLDCRHRMEMEATEDVVRFVKKEPLLRPVPETEYAMAQANNT